MGPNLDFEMRAKNRNETGKKAFNTATNEFFLQQGQADNFLPLAIIRSPQTQAITTVSGARPARIPEARPAKPGLRQAKASHASGLSWLGLAASGFRFPKPSQASKPWLVASSNDRDQISGRVSSMEMFVHVCMRGKGGGSCHKGMLVACQWHVNGIPPARQQPLLQPRCSYINVLLISVSNRPKPRAGSSGFLNRLIVNVEIHTAKSRSHGPTPSNKARKRRASDSDSGGSPVKSRGPSKRKVKAPKKADEDLDDDESSGAARVFWDKDPTRTDRLLEWLTTNVDDRVKLFSDSTQDAVKEGRRKKTAKTSKMTYYQKIADAVFAVDASESVREDYKKKPERYARSVENYIKRDVNKELGQTGAGLRVEDVVAGSDIGNKIEQLHGFWRTLPNFNPFTVSSEPGQDIAEQALALLTGDTDNVNGLGELEPPKTWPNDDRDLFGHGCLDHTPAHSPEPSPNSQPITEWSPSPTKSASIELDAHSPPPKLSLKLPQKPQALRNSSKPNVHSCTPTSSASSSSVKPRAGKRSRTDAFADETEKQNKILAGFGKDKHDRRMAELAVKRQKLEVDLQRESLAAEERRLAAEDRRREAEHKREREREQHQLMLLRMQLTMQHGRGGNGINNAGFLGGDLDVDMFGGFGADGGAAMGYFGGVGPSSSGI
ncbi:hypothetical protein C8R44DRAFT_752903 [Mycena epipterygia]|nr:hypothetical protein C8R44DRAFT_752903 [Mycena epipterygia]